MDHYEKEPSNISHFVEPDPFDPAFERILVLDDSNVRRLVISALKKFSPTSPIVWHGQGRATSKVVTCAEIMKTYFKTPIYQITRTQQMR